MVGVFGHPGPDIDPDSDGDGVSDYAELHKYFTDPHKANSAAERKEFTYTITSVLQIAKPFNLADMNDDYQDARKLSEDEDSMTVEVVYYPLNTNKYAIGENPNWRRDYAHMTQYLRPTATENDPGGKRKCFHRCARILTVRSRRRSGPIGHVRPGGASEIRQPLPVVT